MRTEHLRIGNLINHKIYGQCVVTAIDSQAIRVIKTKHLIGEEWFPIDDFTPINLNDEWLLKFGLYEREFSFDKGSFYLTKRIGEKAYLYQETRSPFRVEFVHQIQNLYFALKSEEL